MPPYLSVVADGIFEARDVASSTNSTIDALQVICVWPVSGQYGPGSRVLYYTLVAACILAKRVGWVVNACLAAALLLPAVAAIHGIVLTALHVDGAVDMDIYGAFQLCSIGILAAPLATMMSKTYFNDPGRNVIFLWTILILSGLICLAVEFYRIETFDCIDPRSGNVTSPSFSEFTWGEDNTCGLHCSTENGPFSPMRSGSDDNLYIVPAPDKLTFGTATLLAAACCVHAILCLISMRNKILDNWKERLGRKVNNESMNHVIDHTERATPEMMKSINGRIQVFLKIVTIPVFGGAGLAILIIGEMNFFSRQVRYQTEPIASVGQWTPIAGTVMAVVGSLYLLMADEVEAVRGELEPGAGDEQCNCSNRCHRQSLFARSPRRSRSRWASRRSSEDTDIDRGRSPSVVLHTPPSPSIEMSARQLSSPFTRDPSVAVVNDGQGDLGYRHRVAKTLLSIGNWIGTPTEDFFDGSAFKAGRAAGYPLVPAESLRSERLHGGTEEMRESGSQLLQVPRTVLRRDSSSTRMG
ncbi:hypothetical protein EDB80DRAFT_718283 [Ilyonectria destructans]|nr:hypothetical protein EDB80DRAFT_718283 [Ilyonectria destructans]